MSVFKWDQLSINSIENLKFKAELFLWKSKLFILLRRVYRRHKLAGKLKLYWIEVPVAGKPIYTKKLVFTKKKFFFDRIQTLAIWRENLSLFWYYKMLCKIIKYEFTSWRISKYAVVSYRKYYSVFLK